MKIRFCVHATSFLQNLQENGGDKYAGRRREEDTLSRIDPNSEDIIRSFSIEIGRIHASHDLSKMDTTSTRTADPIFATLSESSSQGEAHEQVYLNHRYWRYWPVNCVANSACWNVMHQLFCRRIQLSMFYLRAYDNRIEFAEASHVLRESFTIEFVDKKSTRRRSVRESVRRRRVETSSPETDSDLRDCGCANDRST